MYIETLNKFVVPNYMPRANALGYDEIAPSLTIVKPLYYRHHWDHMKCPD